MRRLLVLAVIMVAGCVQSFAGPIVTIKIRIGKNADECNRFGICWRDSGVSVDFALVTNGTEGGTILQMNDNTGDLDITIPESVWKEKANYFTGTTVSFEEEVNVGKKITGLLKASAPVIIKPGKYLMRKDRNNNVIISIPQK